VCTDTDANIENDDDFLLFFEREDFSRNCVLNPDSRREKEKENVLSVCPSSSSRFAP
jgi:hypothetical protein